MVEVGGDVVGTMRTVFSLEKLWLCLDVLGASPDEKTPRKSEAGCLPF